MAADNYTSDPSRQTIETVDTQWRRPLMGRGSQRPLHVRGHKGRATSSREPTFNQEQNAQEAGDTEVEAEGNDQGGLQQRKSQRRSASIQSRRRRLAPLSGNFVNNQLERSCAARDESA
eukprot:919710-Amphidinium_carterae.2